MTKATMSETAKRESRPLEDATPAPASLAQLDRQMAAEIDHALQGNFQSIEAVLEEVFEERAELIQKPDGSPAIQQSPPREPVQAPTPAAVAFPPDLEKPPLKSSTEPVVEVLPPSKAANPKSPSSADNDVRALREKRTSSGDTQTTSEAGDLTMKPAEPMKPASSIVVKPPRVVTLLMLLNAPLHAMPRALRPVVDVLALTLLLWVPVVWIMVVLNLWREKSSDAPEAATPSQAVEMNIDPSAAIPKPRSE